MWTSLLATLTFAAEPAPPEVVPPPATAPSGHVLIEAHVPAEIRINRRPVAQLFVPATVEVDAPVGTHELSVLVNGSATQFPLIVPPDPDRAVVLIGRSGTSVRSEARVAVEAAALVPIELRGTGPGAVQIRIGAQKYRVAAGATLSISLTAGEYPVSVRSVDGTAIWATGLLTVTGGDVVIVQVTEGRLPEVSGSGVFVANGG